MDAPNCRHCTSGKLTPEATDEYGPNPVTMPSELAHDEALFWRPVRCNACGISYDPDDARISLQAWCAYAFSRCIV